MRILAIDPGTTQSAWVLFDGAIRGKGIESNRSMLGVIQAMIRPTVVDLVAVEFVQCYGMAVGREVYETCWWAGMFGREAENLGFSVKRFGRPTVKSWVTGKGRAKDSDVRQALMMRYGGTKKGDPLHGVVKDIWAAL